MPYKTHPADRHSLILKLSDLLRRVPREEQGDLLMDVERFYHHQEFGSPNHCRNAKPYEPYWFEERLLADANKYLEDGKPLDAFYHCLREHNHGHSGFVDQVRRLYSRPTNIEEQALSERLRDVIIRTAEALIASDPHKLETGPLGLGWLSLTALYECLALLGADVPENLISELKRLVIEYKQAAPEHDEVWKIENLVCSRFGS